MSIWASEDVCGQNKRGKFDGSVVSYINGWSNHYPGQFVSETEGYDFGFAKDVTEETPAAIGTGWLPPWCVPGQERSEDYGLDVDTHLGPWLRLDITMRSVSIWAGLEVGKQDVHSVCLNEQAVRKLRNHLTQWLKREKLYPTEEVSGD